LRYDDVRLAYAGESTTLRRSVVNEDGREESEREKAVSFAFWSFTFWSDGGKSVVAGERFSSTVLVPAEREMNSSLFSLPIPMFSCRLCEFYFGDQVDSVHSTPIHKRAASMWSADAC
jgi:hypothetical protein